MPTSNFFFFQKRTVSFKKSSHPALKFMRNGKRLDEMSSVLYVGERISVTVYNI